MDMTGLRLVVLEDEYLIGLELERIAMECGSKSVHLVTTIDELTTLATGETELDIAILEVEAHGKSSLQVASLFQPPMTSSETASKDFPIRLSC
jgi:hypothetical protein